MLKIINSGLALLVFSAAVWKSCSTSTLTDVSQIVVMCTCALILLINSKDE